MPVSSRSVLMQDGHIAGQFKCVLYLFYRFFSKISTRSASALVKTVVANYMKAFALPLPSDEARCVTCSFDHLVFIAVPIMAVLKMFSSGVGAAAGADLLGSFAQEEISVPVQHIGAYLFGYYVIVMSVFVIYSSLLFEYVSLRQINWKMWLQQSCSLHLRTPNLSAAISA